MCSLAARQILWKISIPKMYKLIWVPMIKYGWDKVTISQCFFKLNFKGSSTPPAPSSILNEKTRSHGKLYRNCYMCFSMLNWPEPPPPILKKSSLKKKHYEIVIISLNNYSTSYSGLSLLHTYRGGGRELRKIRKLY